jgi:hypothetical protein
MSMLPVPLGSDPSAFSQRTLDRARRAQEGMELAVHKSELRARELAEIQMAYSRAAADAARVDLEEEIDVLKRGMELAKGSAAAMELVARKADALSSADSIRFRKIFGG